MPPTRIELVTALARAQRDFRVICDDNTGPDLDVRLVGAVVLEPPTESWWIATGDVQYDTHHGDICAAEILSVTDTPEELGIIADSLMDQYQDAFIELTA